MNAKHPTERLRAFQRRNGKAPRYRAVSEALRRQLREGDLQPGVKLPPLRDLAEHFKVSTSTIRQAIRVLEREGCFYHVADVGAFVNPKYPNRSSISQITISLAVIDLGGAFENSLARGVEQACQQRGWQLQIYDARADANLEARNISRLAEGGARGAIVVPINDHANLETLVKLKLAGFPMVLLDRGVPGLKVDLVESDHEKGAYLATRHLLENGHRCIRMITDVSTVTSVVNRISGFERALIEYDIEPTRNLKVWIRPELGPQGVQEGRPWLGGFEAALPVLRESERPIGIFAVNDFCVWGVMMACRELGLRVPQDVSIVGFDDSDIIRAMTPAITTIAQRPQDLGRTALELLEKRLEPGGLAAEPRHVALDVDLILRSSVEPAGAGLVSLDSNTM